MRQAPLVAFLPKEMRDPFLDAVSDIAHADETQSGETLFKLGDRNTDEGLFILEGAVKVTRANGDVRYLLAPDVLGEVQLFAPGAERTATVEVVYGGAVMRFSWRELGAKAKSIYNAAELTELRRAIRESADAREKNLLKSLEIQPRPTV